MVPGSPSPFPVAPRRKVGTREIPKLLKVGGSVSQEGVNKLLWEFERAYDSVSKRHGLTFSEALGAVSIMRANIEKEMFEANPEEDRPGEGEEWKHGART